MHSYPDEEDATSMADRVAVHIAIARSLSPQQGEVILSVIFAPHSPSSHGDDCELGSAMKEIETLFAASGLHRVCYDLPMSEMLAWTQPAACARQLLDLSALLQVRGWTVSFDDNLAEY